MSKRLFIGNLTRDVTDEELSQVFAPFGIVRRAEVVRGRGGKGRGFGYVELASDEGATRAIRELNGREMHGRTITVGEALSLPRRSRMEEEDRRAELFRAYGSGGSSRRGRP